MSSINELPAELVEYIIDFALHSGGESMADALNFALVSRKWNPRCRHYLELSLDESRVRFQKLRTFTELCQHPLSTFKFVGALLISNVGNTRIGLKRSPLDHTAANALFSRRFHTKRRELILESAFGQVNKLTIDRVGWWTLNDMARKSLHNGFRFVTDLDLRNVSFTDLRLFHELICSFPLLERMVLILQQPFPTRAEMGQLAKNPSLQLPNNLRSIDITTLDVATLGALSILNPCPSLRQFRWRSNAFYQLEKECYIVGKFLESAGSSLVELSLVFNVDVLSNDIRIRKPTSEVAIVQHFKHFHDCVDLAKNPSLQRLTLDIRPDPYLVLFLKHALCSEYALSVESLSIPFLENVIFSLNTRILPKEELTEIDLDTALQHPALVNVQRLEFGVQGFFPRQQVTDRIAQVLKGLMERQILLVPNKDDCAIGLDSP
ncbi:hypothetical protein J3R30DRAFT_90795 [Lentinula aciculospora]|uniref:F-box domain-containing protein n=1 Tax=Lentinula aciculospora TaxID=153920 RepID=A0A9W9AWM4_9AGAR|nr:hypothetical protein J3R30DRAFT_90795 [Lentinula aciculospora]